ncbi:hypothetical protein ACWF94_30870 [Streptomyces sp. NPDC055078]
MAADESELDRLRARIAALEASTGAASGAGAGAGAGAGPPTAPGLPGGRAHHRVRSFFAALLIVVGCVLAPLGLVASWTADEVGDTDRYVDTVAPLASDQDIQSAVATRVTDAVMRHIDINTLLSDVAPADRPRLADALGRLGGSLEGAVKSFVHDKAQDVAASDAFEKLWTEANRKVHAAVDKALTGSGGGAVELTDNAVQIDLGPVVDQVKQRLVDAGLTVAGKIPEVHTSLTVLRSDDIGKLKTWFRLLQLAGFWLPVIAVVLVAGGILLAVRRRRALVVSALAVAFAVALLGIALTAFRAVYLDSLPSGVSRPAAGSVYDALTRYLRSAVRMVITLGVVIALAAWLSGPGRHATLVRRLWGTAIGSARATADHAGLRTGPVGPFVRRHRRWITWLLVAAAVLAYLLWSYPTGWVVAGLALALLLALAIVEFLAAESPAPSPERVRPAGGGTESG